MDWQYLSRDTHFSIWWSIKNRNWNSHIHVLPLLKIAQIISSNTVCMKISDRVGSYTFSGKKFKDFSRIFQDPTLIYMNLPSTKQNVCGESYVLGIKHMHMQKCQNTRAWKQVQTRHSLCISDSMGVDESDERAMGTKKRVFSHILYAFQEFYSLYTWMFVFIYFKSYKHCYFSILFNKKNKDIQETKWISSTFMAIKSDSWNSRVFKTHIDPEVKISE